MESIDEKKVRNQDQEKNKSQTQTQNQDKDQDRGKNQDKKAEDISRISISRAAEKAVLELMEKVNQGFAAGQVNRSQLASWVLVKFADSATAEDIKAIRMDHVNDLVLLEHYCREAKESGKLQPEVRDLIRKLAGIDDAQRKGMKKNLKNVIIDDIKKAEDME